MKDLQLETEYKDTTFGWGISREYPCGCKAYQQNPHRDFIVSNYCDAHYELRLKIVRMEGD